ncbi:CHRD domain-containing protein [Flavobacterium suncheonense]|uniref:CHRD domain-containing protein n=1 Tax=Flavobacterium suncheonense TaxID=350894 RepID=UPI0003FD984A|nr:CHRD domain-containing protein [Flavobacterium suncheonense]
MKTVLKLVFVAFLTAGISSCSSNDDSSSTPTQPTTTNFNATLNGTSEVPANGSAATGGAVLSFNNTNKTFTVTVTYTGITPTAGHVHKGAVGVSGPPVFAFSSLTSPINYTSVPLTAEQEADLKANLYYINLHTSAYPDGEIRGQLIKQTSTGGGGNGGGGNGGGGY